MAKSINLNVHPFIEAFLKKGSRASNDLGFETQKVGKYPSHNRLRNLRISIYR